MTKKVKEGSTNVSVRIRIIDDTDGTPEQGVTSATSGLALWYQKEGSAKAELTESDLSALTDAHSDGGMLHIDDGYYRVDIPDAAFTGADSVLIGGAVTGMIVIGTELQIVEYDPNDSVRLGLTALPNAAADAAGGLPISDAGGLDLDTQLANAVPTVAAIRTEMDSNSTQLAAIVADTNELQTDWVNGGRLDLIIDAIKAVTDLLPDAGALTSLATAANLATVDTVVDGIQADLSNATDGLGALKTLIDNVQTKANAIEVDTQDLQTQIGTAGAGLTDLGGMSTAMKAEVNAEADTALTDYDPPTNAEMEARTPTAAQLAYIVANAATGMPVTFTTSGGSTTNAVLNQVDGASASSTDDQYNGRLLVFRDGTLKGVVTDITDYDGSNGYATITAIPLAPTASHNARLI